MTKEDLLQRIRENTDAAIAFYQRNANLEIGILRELSKDISVPGVPLFLASMQNTPSRVLEELEASDDMRVLERLALNPNCLARMALPGARVCARLAAAKSRRLNEKLADKLVDDPEVEVRVALAMNPAINPRTQYRLSLDKVPFVRLALLDNRKCDEEFKDALADDIDTIVHLAALTIPRLSVKSMENWALDTDEYGEEAAQLALSTRVDLTQNALERLSKSRHPSVMLSLLEHQKMDEDVVDGFVERGDSQTTLAILRRRELPEPTQQLVWGLHGSRKDVRKALASHPALADSVGLELAATKDAEIHNALAANPSPTLKETHLKLARSASDTARKYLLANPQCRSDEIIEEIVLHGDHVVLSHLAARKIPCGRLSERARLKLSENPLPSVQALASQASE